MFQEMLCIQIHNNLYRELCLKYHFIVYLPKTYHLKLSLSYLYAILCLQYGITPRQCSEHLLKF